MSVKERVIAIRLIEMIHRTPEYADEIGIKGEMINFANENKTKTVTPKGNMNENIIVQKGEII